MIWKDKKAEFVKLFQEFVSSYPYTPAGLRHTSAYDEQRQQGRRNFEAIAAASECAEDVSETVLLQLLPYTDSATNQQKGAWIHIAPCITGDLKGWLESLGWTKPEDWPLIAQAILSFIRRCNDDPSQLSAACTEFLELPYSKGFQTGMLTPILNTLRPDDFLLINNKSRQAINYFANTAYSQNLTDYPAANLRGHALIAELAEEIRQPGVPDLRDDDLFDMFCHWLVAIKKYDFVGTRYWKSAPGENAWHWEECRNGNFIAIGWDECGDISRLSRAEFDSLRDELIAKHPEWKWKKAGLNQVWVFAQIKEGDRIVANRGITEVLGIGTVTGSYYFVPGVQQGHRLPVHWDDLTLHQVNEGGWRRTLVEIGRDKFEEICEGSTVDEKEDEVVEVHPKRPFTIKTFDLLAELHRRPKSDFYLAHKEEFKEYVEKPFQQVFNEVAAQLPNQIAEQMETKNRIFAKILKNDWGQGGAWDFYWGAFYSKGGKRTEDAQLFMWLNHERMEFGFYIGEHGSAQRKRFLRNCQENYEVLSQFILPHLTDSSIMFGSRENFSIGSNNTVVRKTNLTWEDWLNNPGAADIHVAVILPKSKVLHYSAEQLIQQIAQTFEQIFPLVLVATSDEPMRAIKEYLNSSSQITLPLFPQSFEETKPNHEYTLAHCAEESCFEEATLERWVRAINRKGQAILYGSPGTGKTFIAEQLARHLTDGGDGFWEVVQFHPAYAYEDFIQGIRPQARLDGQLNYHLVPGRFLEFCNKAESCKDRCVLIIDEINRANLAQVFGELMYLLEYRDRTVPLAAGGTLRIPANVRIIGTMNTADRSIALVDHALRRRFAFLALYPNYEVLRQYHEREKTGFPVERLSAILKQLNQAIANPHYEIGISFFLLKDLANQIEDIWRMEIEPFLEEYFFDEQDQDKVKTFRWAAIKQDVLL